MQIRLLRWVRSLSIVLGSSLALVILALIVASYEGLQQELNGVLNGPIAHTITLFFDAPTPASTESSSQAADPEGLQLFHSPYAAPLNTLPTLPGTETESPVFTTADLTAIQHLPNVQAIAWSNYETPVQISQSLQLPFLRISPTYFDLMGLQLTQGHVPTPADRPNAVVVGSKVVDHLLNGRPPIGATLGTSAFNQVSVVGVLAPISAKRPPADQFNAAAIFRVDATLPDSTPQLWIQVQPGTEATVYQQVQTQMAGRLPGNYQVVMRSQREQYSPWIVGTFQRLATQSLSWMIVLSTCLAALTIGIAGYFNTVLRVREIGIRRSMGATRPMIVWLLVRRGLLLMLISIVLAVVLAWLLRPLAAAAAMTQPIFGLLTISSVCGTALIIGSVAHWLPARAVGRMSPSVLLRQRTGQHMHRRRWLWGGPGIALSLLALVVVLGLRNGLAARMDEVLQWTGKRTIGVIGWSTIPDPFQQSSYITTEDYAAVQQAFPQYHTGWVGHGTHAVVEASANVPDILPIVLKCGRWISPAEEQQRKQVLVLGDIRADLVAREQQLDDVCAITSWHGVPVIGVLDRWEEEEAAGFVPGTAYSPIGSRIKPVLDVPGATWPWDRNLRLNGQVIVQVPPDEDLGQAAERLRAFLAPRHPEGIPQLILPAGVTEDLLARRNQIYTLAGVMALLCLLIGGIGLLNLTFISVLSRAREIGIRRALGATKRRILGQILGEVVRLCLGAALLGAAAGLAIARVLQVRFGWPPTTPWELIALAAGLAVLVGLAAGILPAWWAANLPPTRAIKSE